MAEQPEQSDQLDSHAAAAPPDATPVTETPAASAAAEIRAQAAPDVAQTAPSVATETAAETPLAPTEPVAAASVSNAFSQAELDALASQLPGASNGPSAHGETAPAPPSSSTTEALANAQAEIDALKAEMTAALDAESDAQAPAASASVADAQPAPVDATPAVMGATCGRPSPADAAAFAVPDLSGTEHNASIASIDLLDDVQLDVKIELGRTGMYIEDVLRLGVGAVVSLDKLAGDPVDIYVNDRLIAHGEVLVLNDNFCVRISDIHSPIPELDEGK